MSKVTKDRITKRRKLQNVEKDRKSQKAKKGQKLQKAEKGRKIWYSMGKIRGKIYFLRIKKGSKKFPWAFSSSKQCRKKQKCQKLQKAEKGRKIRYSMGKIRGNFSSLRIKR
jgi:hypothetical protein